MLRARWILTLCVVLGALVELRGQSDCEHVASTTALGDGTAGAGGVPSLTSPRLPLVGERFPKLLVEGGLPGASAVLVLGGSGSTTALPEYGGALHAAAPLRTVPFTLDARGRAELELGTQPVVAASACGSVLVAQVGVEDPAAQGAYALSAGLELRFGGPSRVALFSGATSEYGTPAERSFADFDGDGVTDVLVNHQGAHLAEVRLGDGHGNFAAASHAFDVDTPRDPVVADFDHDGRLDIVLTAGPEPQQVLMFRGLGDGRFELQPGFAASVSSRHHLAAADFDDDGELDLVTHISGGPNNLRVWRGDGAGDFELLWTFALGESPREILAEDVNGDGFVDIAVLQFEEGDVTVLLGTGDGAFAAPEVFTLGAITDWLVAADLDGDGDAELITSSFLQQRVDVLDVDGAGRLGLVATLDAPVSARATAHDADGDGRLDILVPEESTRRIAIHRGLAGGGFGPGEPLAQPVRADEADLHDLDLDGTLDLVVGTLHVFRGRPGGDFGFRALAVGEAPRSLGVVDVDGDELDDLVYAASGAGVVEVMFAASPGRFADPVSLAAGPSAQEVDVADLDGDGIPDLVVRNDVATDAHTVLLGEGGGVFAAPFAEHVGNKAESVVLADMNGDRILDLVVGNAGPQAVLIALGAGDGSFGPMKTHLANHFSSDVHVADVDGDGALDAIGGGSLPIFTPNGLIVLRGDGAGSLGPSELTFGPQVDALELADLDGDGDLDVVAVPGPSTFAKQVSVSLNQGDGSFAAGPQYELPSSPYELALGDLNRDGHVDVAALSSLPTAGSLGIVSVLLGKGDGSFDPQLDFQVGGFPSAVTLADVNDDGWPDLIVTCEGHDELYVMFNQRGG